MTREPPRGPIKLLRRRVLPALAKLCALAGLFVLVLWIVGRVLTDQFVWSQYLWWVPPIWAIGSAWGLLVVSAVFGRFALRPGGIVLRPILMLGCVGCSVFLLIGIWRVQRVVFTPAPSPRESSLRVLHWNQSAYNTSDKAPPIIKAQDADLVLVVNARRNKSHKLLLESLSEMAPSDTDHRIVPGTRVNFDPNHVTVRGQALVASRYPILRTSTAYVNPEISPEDAVRPNGQSGWIMFIELDIHELDPQGPGTMVVWLVDLPSEPMLWRMESMREAVAAINRWNGVYWTIQDDQWRAVDSDGLFPSPDLVIGDFNTLRGSASLMEIAPGTRDAFAQAGHGRGGSWVPRIGNRFLRQPMRLADWHIDLALTGPNWRATDYRLIDPPIGPHKIQVIDVVPVEQ
ncbi:MAG: hypothetical protein KC996_00405 [Phycisphaerales bacterium]|nr:hypothetical protein [Phycisphaerales bacterium]